jgi:hypothetical protein
MIANIFSAFGELLCSNLHCPCFSIKRIFKSDRKPMHVLYSVVQNFSLKKSHVRIKVELKNFQSKSFWLVTEQDEKLIIIGAITFVFHS